MIYFLKQEHQEWTVRDCLLKVPHMTLSTIGYDLFSLMILLLCLERVTAFYKLGLHYVIFDIDRTLLILISCFLIISVKITAAWVIAFMDMYKKVSAWCHMRECMNPIIYRSTAWTYMIIGYLTVVFYLATVALLLHRRSTTCTIMRQIQLNRERSIARNFTLDLGASADRQTYASFCFIAFAYDELVTNADHIFGHSPGFKKADEKIVPPYTGLLSAIQTQSGPQLYNSSL
ncbi:hypothetical protein T4D_11974 [Trichinella pseudospiralis]|uniref:Uncharacterized protein n=1 Tax=Trichinella pseudospiralis TaxID=6337 RepID=A0A0V1F9B9_TRIPS|nr:hypothetical protein T4D_11974 [Trichinella pseudospiralis]